MTDSPYVPPSAESTASKETLYDLNFFFAAASQTCFVIANTLMAHYARWIEFLGGSVRDVGWVMSVGAILGVFFRPWIGQWINRFGAKRMWMGGFCVFAVGASGNLLVGDVGPTIYLLRAIVVLGAAVVFSSGLTYISQIAPVHRQAEAIGVVGIGGFVGMLIGPLLGDLLLGSDIRARGDFATLFTVAAVGNLLTVLLVLQLRSPTEQTQPTKLTLGDFIASTRRYWPGTILLVDLAFGLSMAIPFGFLASFIDQVGLKIPGVSIMGLYFWCYAGSGILLRILGRRLPELIGRKRLLVAGMSCMAAGIASFTIVDANLPYLIVVPALLSGIAHGMAFHTMTSLTLASFPDHLHGTGSSLALMMLDIGTIGGAPLLALIADSLSFRAMFLVAAAVIALATLSYTISCIRVYRLSKASY
ncbi:MAG: hypothetical protein Aurels2KO_18630 [Aureliella sp.]